MWTHINANGFRTASSGNLFYTQSFAVWWGRQTDIFHDRAELDVCPAVVRVLMGQGALTLWMKGPQSEYLKEVGIK